MYVCVTYSVHREKKLRDMIYVYTYVCNGTYIKEKKMEMSLCDTIDRSPFSALFLCLVFSGGRVK